jgi:hypothetical protein
LVAEVLLGATVCKAAPVPAIAITVIAVAQEIQVAVSCLAVLLVASCIAVSIACADMESKRAPSLSDCK